MAEPVAGAAVQTGLSVNRNPRALLLTLTIAASLGQIASTIYVPSVPAIASALETSVAHVQFTFVGYLLAFAASMLVLGPLSDRYGRRRIMTFGVALSAIGSIACVASPTIELLIAARILQGVGLAGGMVIGRAIVRDLYEERGSAQIIAGMAIAMTLLQAFAPIPGGYLQTWIGWRANFTAVALLTAVAWVLVVRYVPRVTSTGESRSPTRTLPAGVMLQSYRNLVKNRRFLGYALTATGAHAGFHIFAAGTPAVFILSFGIAPESYGYYASLPPIGFLVGSFLSNRLTVRLGIDWLIAIGSAALIPAGFGMLVLALLNVASPYAIVGPMIVICLGSGLITPNAVAGGLGVRAGVVGTASGLTSFFQMTGAAGATAALSLGASGSPIALSVIIASAGLLAVTAFASLARLDPDPLRRDPLLDRPGSSTSEKADRPQPPLRTRRVPAGF